MLPVTSPLLRRQQATSHVHRLSRGRQRPAKWRAPKAVCPDDSVSGASAILHALQAAGVTHLFVNLGSDHPAFLTAFATKAYPRVKVVTSPNEMNALSAASGYAMITGRPAAVLVHVECGTQALAGAVHNISKGRLPVVIVAGTVPITMEGELPGSRNECVDIPDQRSIVRQYMKYDHEIRSPHNAVQIVLRALQIATSTPQGPTYLIASRETLEAQTSIRSIKPSQDPKKNLSVEKVGLHMQDVARLGDILIRADFPLIVTSYAGRDPAAFKALHDLARRLAIPVHENAPVVNNFPTTSFLHQGHAWNGGGQLKALAEADVVLVVDSDVPWIPSESRPSDAARIFHLDCDPLKSSATLWSLPAEKRWMCDTSVALKQLDEYVEMSRELFAEATKSRIDVRISLLAQRFEARTRRLEAEEVAFPDGKVTVPYFMSRFRKATKGLDVLALNESTTNLGKVADHLRHDQHNSLVGSGGGSLGWYSGAAVGVAMALREEAAVGDAADRLVTAFVGDGTFLFGVPASAYWMAMRYATPYLTVIWNNGGWTSPKNACLRIHPEMKEFVPRSDGEGRHGDSRATALAEAMGVSISPSPSFGKIAEGAGDAWWTVVKRADEVDGAIAEGVRVVRELKRCAVIEVAIASV
ncbi:acetolactate synthase [Verticillium alfalfae VaMs.102]|uniref:Acetolactate synthase n=1 Tax=Verticillium alfalfae (strain VaMs.102 / ATCC MYA-4576 / FGSC 10136) TaxID=526221 RepID=C9SWV5_VERA1|nr:acetolactate synthase [Verticillium alfalfae VaMs.102]EEY23496.1 acetolactate synthase [Verticillium alfalfae VaMs.102]